MTPQVRKPLSKAIAIATAVLVIAYAVSSADAQHDAYYEGDIEPFELEQFVPEPAAIVPVETHRADTPPLTPVPDPPTAHDFRGNKGTKPESSLAPQDFKLSCCGHTNANCACDACSMPTCTSATVGSCCDDGGCPCECDESPWRLQDQLMPSSSLDGIQFGGWIQAGVRTNSHGNSTSLGNVPGGGFTNDADEFNLHQLWAYAGKEADTGGCGADWGFGFDFVYGVDGPDTQAFGDIGWDTEWDSGGQYGSAIPQLYLQGAWDDWNIVVGKFFTIIGYEVVQAPGNFFFTHSYQQYYAEPFTHTGALVGYDVDRNFTINAGYTMGWDSGFNNSNEAHTFLGGITWTSDDESTSIAYAINAGDFGNGDVQNAGDIYLHSFVVSQEFGDGWTAVVQHDLGVNNNVPAAPPLDTTEWYGVGAYLFKQLDCCWSAGARLEWFRDDDGVRVNPLGVPPILAAGSYYEATVGLNYQPHDNLRLRPEVRYDWFDGAGSPFDPVGGIGTAKSLFSFAVDLIVTF